MLSSNIKWSWLKLVMICGVVHRNAVDCLFAQRNGDTHACCLAGRNIPARQQVSPVSGKSSANDVTCGVVADETIDHS